MACEGTPGARFGMIRDSQCWDRRTLKRSALHCKKLGPNGSHFTGPQPPGTQYLEKFCAEMTHIWPGNPAGRDGLVDVLIIPGRLAAPDCSEVNLESVPNHRTTIQNPDRERRCHRESLKRFDHKSRPRDPGIEAQRSARVQCGRVFDFFHCAGLATQR